MRESTSHVYVDLAFSFLSSLPPPPRPNKLPTEMSQANNNLGNSAGGARGGPGGNAGGDGGKGSGGAKSTAGGARTGDKRKAKSPPGETPEQKRVRLAAARADYLFALEEQEREYWARVREFGERAEDLARRRRELEELEAGHPEFAREFSPDEMDPVEQFFAGRSETPPRRRGDFEEPVTEDTSEVLTIDRVDPGEGASQ